MEGSSGCLSSNFKTPCPSISPMTSPRDSDALLCLIRAYTIYVNRSQEWLIAVPLDQQPVELWLVPRSTIPASPDFLSDSFKRLVRDSRRAFGGVEALWRGPRALAGPEVPIGIHQMRKLAATYAIQAGQHEQLVKVKLGF